MVELKIIASIDGERYSEGHSLSVPELVSLCQSFKIHNLFADIDEEEFIRNWLKDKENG